MSVFDISGNILNAVYSLSGSSLSQAYDIDGNELFVNPAYPDSLVSLHSESISTRQSPQGMSTYGNYIFQFFSTVNKLKVFSLSDYSLINSIDCDYIGHANNMQFGDDVTETGFPLLYASDNPDSGTQNVYVIKVTTSSATLYDTIALPSAVGNAANAVFDFASGYIYTLGYTKTASDSTGKNIICKLSLDSPSTVLDTWQYDYLGVANALVWDGTHIILNANTWDGTDVKFIYINPMTKAIDHTSTFVKEYDSEFQGMAEQSGWILVSKWIYKTVSGTRTLFYEFFDLS